MLFANVLAKDISLRSIKLFNSKITAPGATALANSLLSNTHLKELDLGCNSIDTDGTLAFAKSLEKNWALQCLKIGVYSADNKGVKAFANLLEKNIFLTEFDYNDLFTSGDQKDKIKIKEGLARNKNQQQEVQKAHDELFSLVAMLYDLKNDDSCTLHFLPKEILLLIAIQSDTAFKKLDLNEERRLSIAHTFWNRNLNNKKRRDEEALSNSAPKSPGL